jgi:hypothetical protein
MLIPAGQALAVDQQPMLACWPLAVSRPPSSRLVNAPSSWLRPWPAGGADDDR